MSVSPAASADFTVKTDVKFPCGYLDLLFVSFLAAIGNLNREFVSSRDDQLQNTPLLRKLFCV